MTYKEKVASITPVYRWAWAVRIRGRWYLLSVQYLTKSALLAVGKPTTSPEAIPVCILLTPVARKRS